MVVRCTSCNSTETIFDDGCQYYCCSRCGLLLDSNQVNNINNNNNDDDDEDTGIVADVKISPLLESRYRPIFQQLQNKFNATDEETDFIRQLCYVYLRHPNHIFQNSALEVVLCLFYLVILQHLEDQSLLLSDYCQLMNGDSKRCLTIYAAVRRIVSTKLASVPNDYDPQYQLDNIMRFLYPAFQQSTPSSPSLQHGEQQSHALFSYHETPFTAYKKLQRTNKKNQHKHQHHQKKRHKISASPPSTTTTTTTPPLSPSSSEATLITDLDRPELDANTDDDTSEKLGHGEPLVWPSDMTDVEIRKQTTRLMIVAKRNGLADGRYGRPLMSACLLITMLGWFHRDQRRNQQSTTTGIKKMVVPKSRSVSLLSVVVIHWDELYSRQLVNSTTKFRYKEMVRLLYTFGKNLPWLKENLSMERDVLHYLDDILQMMDALQNNNNNNNNAAEGHTSTNTRFPSEQVSLPTPSSDPATPPSPSPYSTTTVGPYLPPSFERAARVRQKRGAELDAFDRWNHTRQYNQQLDNNTTIWNDSGLTYSEKMVASLVTSQQYDREAILAMSDGGLVKNSYRFTSTSSSTTNLTNNSTTSSLALDLDRKLDDFDLSKEELDSYLV